MNSRDAQDVILRLLADGPYRTARLSDGDEAPADVAELLARVDRAGLSRFARFLCRHYYRERVVHFFKYSRALAPLTTRLPEAALKTAEFTALIPILILGDRASAQQVLDLLHRHLTAGADLIRTVVPYWDTLIEYQSVFLLSDASPPPPVAKPFPARAETATILELEWDLPPILPQLLRPFSRPPMPSQRRIRLLFARSPHGEVTVLRCTDALRDLLESLSGQEEPGQLAARLGLHQDSFGKTLQKLEQLGAVIAQESFSASHVGSELPGRQT